MRRKTEYRSLNRKVKKLVKKNERKVEEEFGIRLSEKFNEDNKLFLKEVEEERRRSRECESED